MLIIKKKRKICVPNSLSISRSWNIIGPIVAREIGVPDYTPIPYCFDTNAYKLGHIFVPIGTQMKCFRTVPVLKVLGPIRNFVIESETNFKWLDKEFYSVRTTGNQVDFQVSINDVIN
ncbi:hypothetical protein X777_08988 [Ooceraea biroi]|uniref:Uncharacterized protein n=1 Tax=Ooceraea biroi TaxID=2015173 RepID=A0A026W8L6_OOCBI|nr:hypothetical protein X777_08988 [Ooceraea biroi]